METLIIYFIFILIIKHILVKTEKIIIIYINTINWIFEILFNCILTLNHVSLKITVTVLSLRIQIRENINNLCNEMDDIKNEIHSKKYFIIYNIYKN